MNFVPIAPQWTIAKQLGSKMRDKMFILIKTSFIDYNIHTKNVCALCMYAYFLALLMGKP